MFAAVSQLMPLATKFCRQVVPPVVATLIAAVLIASYNKTFSGHLVQPRMAAMHVGENAQSVPTAPITTVGMTKPHAPPAPPVTETITIYEEMAEPERLMDKDARDEAGKDPAVRLAMEALPAPVRTITPAPKPEPKIEPHRVASVELAPPALPAPAPVIVAVPPPTVAPLTVAPLVAAMAGAQAQQPLPQYQQPTVIMGTPPMVTVPDRPAARPIPEPVNDAQAEPPPPPQGPIGMIVNTLKPSNLLARARAFGEKIEAAGNEILPNIRQ